MIFFDRRKFRCELCGFTDRSIKPLREHLKQKHGVWKPRDWKPSQDPEDGQDARAEDRAHIRSFRCELCPEITKGMQVGEMRDYLRNFTYFLLLSQKGYIIEIKTSQSIIYHFFASKINNSSACFLLVNKTLLFSPQAMRVHLLKAHEHKVTKHWRPDAKTMLPEEAIVENYLL